MKKQTPEQLVKALDALGFELFWNLEQVDWSKEPRLDGRIKIILASAPAKKLIRPDK
jgi:hypothetical protein